MRKTVLIWLVFIPLYLLTGCNSNNTDQQTSLSLYYRQVNVTYNQPNNLISSEQIPWSDDYYDIETLLSVYLQGPKTENLTNLFPVNTRLAEIKMDDKSLSITLSKEADNMDKLSLSIGGACLSTTIFPYTDAETILIEAEGGFTALSEPLAFTRDNILFQDNAVTN